MYRQKVQRQLELDFGDQNTIDSKSYKRTNRENVSFVEQAAYLIENGYPVPTQDVNELAFIMQENFEKRLDEEKRKEYDLWRKQEGIDSN